MRPAEMAWQIFFTMEPCPKCPKGADLVATFTDGKQEYGAIWEKRKGAAA
jgi:hypothetical protein